MSSKVLFRPKSRLESDFRVPPDAASGPGPGRAAGSGLKLPESCLLDERPTRLCTWQRGLRISVRAPGLWLRLQGRLGESMPQNVAEDSRKRGRWDQKNTHGHRTPETANGSGHGTVNATKREFPHHDPDLRPASGLSLSPIASRLSPAPFMPCCGFF